MTIEQMKRDRARLEYEARSDEVKVRIDNQVKKLDALFKNLTLVNGGAIIALFTLLGNIDKAKVALDTHLLWWSFLLFVVGLTSTIVAIGFSFFSQYYLSIRAKRQAWNEQAAIFGFPPEYDAKAPFDISNKHMRAMWCASAAALVLFIAGALFAMLAVIPS